MSEQTGMARVIEVVRDEMQIAVSEAFEAGYMLGWDRAGGQKMMSVEQMHQMAQLRNRYLENSGSA